ncbi:hypothetical protein [Streptomyces platensis]|uniref:hypothetical protein n=1 Tax=Streptomyces platensis TaxID=58346 RepID=UPI001F1AAD23|nr:hypothetical protein [Streptomyces platensis]MCF3142823.1 hypothetical protein [Streptomyces platensis]
MNSSKAKRLLAAVAVTVTALATPVAAAGSAMAENQQVKPPTTSAKAVAANSDAAYWCIKKLSAKGYQIGPKSIHACDYAGDPADGNRRDTCVKLLKKTGVKSRDADHACTMVHG